MYRQDARRLLHDGEFDKAIGSARQAMERILAVTDWPAISKNDDLFQRNQAQRWRAITRRRSTKHRVPNTLMR
ncbi:hypothetical protein ACFZDJ_25240 [Streptomyces sp. NPDC007896]|uniref:hypothetical protein n=1 Tax=unclassified Streptomyces TaxID=2593676 RepID=UPI0036E4271B